MPTPFKIQIIVDDKGSVKIRQVGTEAEKAGRKGAESFRRTGKSLDEMNQKAAVAHARIMKVVGAVVALSATAYALKKLVDVASDLEEVTSKFNVVFAGQIPQAEKWAKTLVDSYAMSTREAKQYLSSVQDLLVPMGMQAKAAGKLSNEIVKLSADLGSFNNLPTGQVMDDIQSALVGNYETMKKYGVVLNATVVQEKALAMGLAGTKDALTAADKAQAAYALMVKGSTAAIGDMARTSDSYANQVKQLQANVEDLRAMLGNKFLPVATDVVQKINEWVKANDELIEQKVEDTINDIKDGVQGILDVYNAIPASAGGAVGMGLLGRIILGNWGVAKWLVVAGVVDTIATRINKMAKIKVVPTADMVSEGYMKLFEALKYDAERYGAAIKAIAEEWGNLKVNLSDPASFTRFTETLKRIQDAFNGIVPAVTATKEELEAIRQMEILEGMNPVMMVMERFLGDGDEIADKLQAIREELKKGSETLGGAGKTTESFGISTKKAAKQVKALAAAIAEANREIKTGLYIGDWEMISGYQLFAGYEQAANHMAQVFEDAQASIKDETKDTTKYVDTLWDKALNRVEKGLTETFQNTMTGKLDNFKGFFRSFAEDLLRIWNEKMAAMTMYSLFDINTGTGAPQGWGSLLGGLTGSGGSGGGGGFGIMDLLSLGKSGYEMYSGNSLISSIGKSVAGYLGIGGYGTTTAAGMAVGIGGSVGTTTLTGATGTAIGFSGVGAGSGAGMSGAAAGGLYAAAIIAATMIFEGIAEHQMKMSGGPSHLGTHTSLAASTDPNKLFTGHMYAAGVSGGEWDTEHANKAAANIAGLIADTMDVYNVLFANLSEATQEAVKSALTDIDKLDFVVSQFASEGTPILGSFMLDTSGKITGKEWGDIGRLMQGKWTDSVTMLAPLTQNMQDAIVASIEEGGELTGQALADIMDIGIKELTHAFTSDWGENKLGDFLDEINQAFTGGSEKIGEYGTVPEAMKSVFGDYFEDYIQEGLDNMKGKEIFSMMTQDIQDAFNSLDLEMFTDDINEFNKVFTDAGFKIEKASQVWDSLQSFVGKASDEITQYEKATSKAQIEVAAYTDMMAKLGTTLTDTEIAAKTKEVMKRLTEGITDLEAATKPLGAMGQLVAGLHGQYDAYVQALKDSGVVIEESTELLKMRFTAEAKLLDEYKASIGLFGDDYLKNLKLDEIADKYKKFGMSFEEMAEWLKDATLTDVKAIADSLDIEWTDIADDIGYLVKNVDDLGDVAASTAAALAKTIQESKWALSGSDDLQIAYLEKKYGVDPGTFTKDYIDKIVAAYQDMGDESILKFLEDMDAELEDFIKDLMFLQNAFSDVSDSVEDVANDIEDYAQQIKDVLAGGGPNAVSSQTASALWAQVQGMQGGAHTGESLLLMSETLVKWYDAAVREAEEKARQEAETARLFEQVIDRASALVSQVKDTIRDIKYSDFNRGLPREMAAESQLDYDTLLTAARIGGVAEVQEYLGFVSTYLQQQQKEYKSSQKYQGTPDSIYETVMRDMEAIKARAEAGGYDAMILEELKSGNEEVHADLTAINAQFADMETWIMNALREVQAKITLDVNWPGYSETGAAVMQSIFDFIAQHGMNSQATIDFLSTLDVNMFKDVNELALAAGWIANNTGGWDSKATIAFIKNVAANWQFENLNEMLAAAGWIATQAGSWSADASIAFIAGLYDRYGKDLTDLAAFLEMAGLNDIEKQEFYIKFFAQLAKGADDFYTNIDAWLTSVGITDKALQRDIKVNVMYEMYASGKVNIPQLADFAYMLIADAATANAQGDKSGAYAIIDDLAALVIAIATKGNAGDLGQWVGDWSAKAQLAGYGNNATDAAALKHLFNEVGYPLTFAQGGIIDQPTLAWMGEAGYKEAVIPMLDGYSIPVKWINGGSTQGAADRGEEISLLREEVALLQTLVAQNGRPFEIGGRALDRYVDARADRVRVKANRRPGNETERMYQ